MSDHTQLAHAWFGQSDVHIILWGIAFPNLYKAIYERDSPEIMLMEVIDDFFIRRYLCGEAIKVHDDPQHILLGGISSSAYPADWDIVTAWYNLSPPG